MNINYTNTINKLLLTQCIYLTGINYRALKYAYSSYIQWNVVQERVKAK